MVSFTGNEKLKKARSIYLHENFVDVGEIKNLHKTDEMYTFANKCNVSQFVFVFIFFYLFMKYSEKQRYKFVFIKQIN